jgi:hypothetical protein
MLFYILVAYFLEEICYHTKFHGLSLISISITSVWLVAGLPPQRPGFTSGQHVGFVVDKVALGQVFLQVLQFPLPIIIPPISPSS